MNPAAFDALLDLMARGPLAEAEAHAAFAAVLDGAVDAERIRAFLLASTGPCLDAGFLAAGAGAMRARMRPAFAPPGAIDVCGTGGDGAGTLNVSTATAFVVAAAGVPVAKHGNRAASSRSGAADVLAALGVALDLDPARSFAAANLAFLFAPTHHPALAALAPIRRALGVRTVFNLLGPLCNPAGVTRQLVGVSDPALLDPMAEALRRLGAQAALVVCGEGGVDEITPYGATGARALRGGTIAASVLTPADFGLDAVGLDPKTLIGGAPEENALRLRQALAGAPRDAYWAAIICNAAAALMVLDPAMSPQAAAANAAARIADGKALDALDRLIGLRP